MAKPKKFKISNTFKGVIISIGLGFLAIVISVMWMVVDTYKLFEAGVPK